jgi:hypothetical protein
MHLDHGPAIRIDPRAVDIALLAQQGRVFQLGELVHLVLLKTGPGRHCRLW